MCHVAPYHCGSGSRSRAREIDRFIEAVSAVREGSVRKAGYILHAGAKAVGKGEERRIRAYDIFPVHSAAQRELLDSVSLVLVVELTVEGVISALRDPERKVHFPSSLLLAVYRVAQRLIAQATALRFEKELGHEVFKHSPRPGYRSGIVAAPAHDARKRSPVRPVGAPAGDGEKAQHSRLGHQHIVAVRSFLAGIGVYAYREQLPCLVVENAHVRVGDETSDAADKRA